MPYPWNAETYARAFRVRVRDPRAPDYGQFVTYGPRFAEVVQQPPGSFYPDRARWVHDVLKRQGLETSARIMGFGVGFGFLIDALAKLGYVNAWGWDASPYVSDNLTKEKPDTARIQIRDLTGMNNPQFAQALTSFTGDWKFDAILTETLLEGYPDNTIKSLLDRAESALTSQDTKRIIHLVHCATPESLEQGVHDLTLGLRWQTLKAWAALRPSHTWIDWATGETT